MSARRPAIRLARRTVRTMMQNIAIALVTVVLLLAGVGHGHSAVRREQPAMTGSGQVQGPS